MIGQTISHYRLDKKLGEGTYGQVFLATHLHDPAMQVAIKVVHKNLSNDPDFVAGLRRECLVLSGRTKKGVVHRDINIISSWNRVGAWFAAVKGVRAWVV